MSGSRVVHLLLALVLLGNLGLIAAWPRLRGSAVRAAVAPVYADLCHQRPERSYALGGEPMPVCARCLGVWLGLLAAALAAAFCGLWRLAMGLTLAGWLLLSWLLGALLFPAGWHLERTVAGLAGGAGLYVLAARLPGRAARRLKAAYDRRSIMP
jgi:hypothetical protein